MTGVINIINCVLFKKSLWSSWVVRSIKDKTTNLRGDRIPGH